ncbi:uroporphyrinogen decarboxylase [Desulfocicer vacuolatum DSM 3385]|uniref:Uroporphyrinogen decarboxylase n=1 Tax=Desulfocicer vacuolatum DSM 3385 TaxID=1121400 RepID=A0A1W2AL20_9BACT|nr:uroporphyrinogen decarboxylase family protein [Desulfocicer vacuolatum]SMC61250.1 uroporphyrinogen decarboxylase [Desulfocicer vacuolatum DSM 3385]
METDHMTSLERVLTTLGHNEPDRVPLFLFLTMHGAKELGLSIKDYFSRGEHVVQGQLKLLEKYGHDCIYNFYHAPLEVEAWGGEVVYCEDGPPNSGTPFIKDIKEIDSLEPPLIDACTCLEKVLTSARLLKEHVQDQVPIIGVVMSPFSLPVMQLGFNKYIELIYESPLLFRRLMEVNTRFCVNWANAQLDAGSTAICYFDPVSSPTIIPRELYLKTGFKVAKNTIAQINGPTATHLASGRGLSIVDDLVKTGTDIMGSSSLEDLGRVKAACRGKLTVLGDLNGIGMCGWTPEQAEEEVKKAIAAAGPGGGFLLSDNHGEIPFQVPDEVLLAISRAVRQWGQYPLDWISS